MKITYDPSLTENCICTFRNVLFNFLQYLKTDSCKFLFKEKKISDVRELLKKFDNAMEFIDCCDDHLGDVNLSVDDTHLLFLASANELDPDAKSFCLCELCQILLVD